MENGLFGGVGGRTPSSPVPGPRRAPEPGGKAGAEVPVLRADTKEGGCPMQQGGCTGPTGWGSALARDAHACSPRNSPGMICHPSPGSPFGVLAGAPLALRGCFMPSCCLLPARPSAPESRAGKHRERGAGYPRCHWMRFIYQLGGKGQEQVAAEESRAFSCLTLKEKINLPVL